MSNEDEVREFLTTRRAKVKPDRAGLPTFGRQRRVPGLRREEVALLAGISVEYYTRLERGNARGVSENVLDAVSRALCLDEGEHDHLVDLARAANAERPPRRTSTPQRVSRTIQRLVDAMTDMPAFVRNGRMDYLHANPMATALYSEAYCDSVRPVNSACFAFLDPSARTFYIDWDEVAHDIVAHLRCEAGRNPYDRTLSDLVAELSMRSEEFRILWTGHDVRLHRSGTKRFRHPLVGDLTLAYEALDVLGDAGLTIIAYSAEPGSPSDAALSELASWSSTRTRLTAAERR
jgi:transcriptional regulator with XRE-family HTH domain